MPYLMIENPGVAPASSFTLLGASMTRFAGNTKTIGQFGSGAKHAIILLMREGYEVVIFCDKWRLNFITEPFTVNDGLYTKTFNRIVCQASGTDPETGKPTRRIEKLGWTLEYGETDWTDINMALREFVANALDRTEREGKDPTTDVVIKFVEDNQVRACSGTTRIFINKTFALQKFYNELPKRFLHFASPKEFVTQILSKNARNLDSETGPVVFKNGVRIRELQASYFSLFDYNLGNEVKLDEARNLEEWSAAAYAARKLANSDENTRRTLINAAIENKLVWEIQEMPDYEFNNTIYSKPELRKTWHTSWNEITTCGIMCQGHTELNSFIEAKGLKCVNVLNPKWYNILNTCGVKTETEILAQDELNGAETQLATPAVEECLEIIWKVLEKYKLTTGKAKPCSKMFKPIMKAGTQCYGEYKNNTVYIHTDIGQGKLLYKVMLEEVIHHLTGAKDKSRDIQDVLFSLVADIVFASLVTK